MCISAAITAAAAVAGVGAAASSSRRANQAQQQSLALQQSQVTLAERAANAAGAKTPDLGALLSSAARAGRAGATQITPIEGGTIPAALLYRATAHGVERAG